MSRTLIVGDVHGCADELLELLDRLAYSSSDQLVFVGDLVAKGPDSRRVLEVARQERALVVLGNHEGRLLEARRARAVGRPGPLLGPGHKRLLSELSDGDWALLASWPLYRRLESVGLLVVHAGVVPGVPVEEQDSFNPLHMRTLDEEGFPSVKRRYRLWGADYVGPPHIVFGHHAREQPQLHEHATGIDTGCVYGKRLTALVLHDKQGVPPLSERAEALVSVSARRRYCPNRRK